MKESEFTIIKKELGDAEITEVPMTKNEEQLVKKIFALQDEFQKFQWISINDRLPDKGVMVLVINDLYPTECHVAESTGETIFYTNLDESSVFPTHWMPLPQAPEYLGEEDE